MRGIAQIAARPMREARGRRAGAIA